MLEAEKGELKSNEWIAADEHRKITQEPLFEKSCLGLEP
jgi:hypothetical protein